MGSELSQKNSKRSVSVQQILRLEKRSGDSRMGWYESKPLWVLERETGTVLRRKKGFWGRNGHPETRGVWLLVKDALVTWRVTWRKLSGDSMEKRWADEQIATLHLYTALLIVVLKISWKAELSEVKIILLVIWILLPLEMYETLSTTKVTWHWLDEAGEWRRWARRCLSTSGGWYSGFREPSVMI